MDKKRIDEVEKYYKPISIFEFINSILFWIIVILTLLIPYTHENLSVNLQSLIIAGYIIFVGTYFIISQILRFYLIPKAEKERRKQLLSDAFGILLTPDKTDLYYNNDYPPSLRRLGANIMENAFFSKKIASKMLVSRRFIIGGYLIILVFIYIVRHENLDVIIWISQIFFSGEIVTKWIKLEVLRKKHEEVYDDMYSHFLHDLGDVAAKSKVNILNSFVKYEATKALASVNLSSRLFHKLNPRLTNEWNRISKELNMNDGSLTDEHK